MDDFDHLQPCELQRVEGQMSSSPRVSGMPGARQFGPWTFRPARAAIWDAALSRFGLKPADYDNVRLAQATGLFTPGEIIACVKRAVNSGEVDERSLLEPIGRVIPIAHRQDEQLASIRHWARAHGIPAR